MDTQTQAESYPGKPRFYALYTEAEVLIEEWRKEYNQVRPHSSLGYRPPAPESKMLETLTL